MNTDSKKLLQTTRKLDNHLFFLKLSHCSDIHTHSIWRAFIVNFVCVVLVIILKCGLNIECLVSDSMPAGDVTRTGKMCIPARLNPYLLVPGLPRVRTKLLVLVYNSKYQAC